MTEQPSTAVAVATEPKPVRVPLLAGSSPRAIVPTDFEGAYRIAKVVVQANMAPKSLETVEQCMVAILHGLEVGLTPMNALQSIAVINGRPTIWGDGAIGLIRASGLLEYMEETFEGDGDKLKAVCVVKRKGEPKPVRGEFSRQDAITAGLLGKDIWKKYPRRMLQMRARWPLRDVFADVLKGLSLREEVEDYDDRANGKAASPAPAEIAAVVKAPSPEEIEAATKPAEPEKVEEKKQDPISSGLPAKQEGETFDDGIPAALRRTPPKPAPAPVPNPETDLQGWLAWVDGNLSRAKTADELDEAWVKLNADEAPSEARRQAADIYSAHAERIEG